MLRSETTLILKISRRSCVEESVKSGLQHWPEMLELPSMHWLQKHFKGFGKPALAALLVVVMTFLTLAAPCTSLHQQLHHDGPSTCETCVLCAMMHGNVDCPIPAPIQSSFVSNLVSLTPAIKSVGMFQIDFQLAPSRAPPCC
jgi:hypothetical protein